MTIGQWLGFRGRIGRRTFWLGYALPLLLASIVANVVDAALGFATMGDAVPADEVQAGPVTGLVALLTLWPALAGAIKRLHDRDRSGWWIGGYYLLAATFAVLVLTGAVMAAAGAGGGMMMLSMVTAVVLLGYAIWLLVEIGFLRGTPGPNRYGPDPLGDAQGAPQWQQGWQQQQQQWQQAPPQWQPPPAQGWQPPAQQGWQAPPQGGPPSPWSGPGPGGSVPPVRRE